MTDGGREEEYRKCGKMCKKCAMCKNVQGTRIEVERGNRLTVLDLTDITHDEVLHEDLDHFTSSDHRELMLMLDATLQTYKK